MRGLFINFEGLDGSGKSSQMKNMASYFNARGVEVVFTREPGGTPYSEMIRDLALNKDPGESVLPMTEVLLFFAARYQHYKKLIEPALLSGKTVLCDRFTPSTIAYQGAAENGISQQKIEEVHRLVLGEAKPDVTIFLDTPCSVSLSRMGGRGTLDRIEQTIHQRAELLRESYLHQASLDSSFRVIDGLGSFEEVSARVIKEIDIIYGEINESTRTQKNH